MTTYFATICHHSISRARVIKIDGTLTQAKAKATREFQGDFLDYVLTIFGAWPNGEINRDEVISSRRLGSSRWLDTER